MHRQSYPNPPLANSPPLHHPVPQHVSSVPQFRSPPPPAPQQQHASAGYGYQAGQPGAGGPEGPGAGGAAGYMHPAFNSFMTDSTAQLGLGLGKTAMMAGHDYVEQNLNRWVSVASLKHYFNVSNSYVLGKLALVLFPWRHRRWSRIQRLNGDGSGGVGGPASGAAAAAAGSGSADALYLPPREDINSPDLYIPLMALVTYILLSTLLAGMRRAFHPELFGMTATAALAVVLLELLVLWFAMYLLNINSESRLVDLFAYSGYKFVGVIVTLVVSEIWNRGGGTGGWVGWAVFLYTFSANAFFLLRSLKYVLLPDTSPNPNSSASYTANRSHRQRRTQFLFVYSYIVQFLFMWILSRQDSGGVGSGAKNSHAKQKTG